METVLVDVVTKRPEAINRSWKNYKENEKSNPKSFFLCTAFIGEGIDAPDYADTIISQLKHEISEGAQMIKVWKNFGMVTKDNSGEFIQIDDIRLQPIWDYLKSVNIPVIAHIGEPEQAWRPLNDPNNPHFGYYTEHPEYHAFKHTEIPSYETIIDARDHWIQKNSDLNIICAHIGSMSHNVDMVADRLDKFPNIHVELAARFGDIARQDSEKVRNFFIKYQDRIMFGTDYGNSKLESTLSKEELIKEESNLNDRYTVLWNYLATTKSVTVVGHETKGLGLPTSVLKKVYAQNFIDFLK
jgi:predicted TIM-barrel fold metal-dependent hydrolase